MKQIKLLLVLMIGFAFGSSAQTKAIESVAIKTPTVQCDMCKARIEKFLGRADGVKRVKVNLKEKTTVVTYLTDRTNPSNLKVEIANIGYDADGETAEETAYSKLPKCCKKPVAAPAPASAKAP